MAAVMYVDSKIQTSFRATVTTSRELPDEWPRVSESGPAHLTVFQSREFVEAWISSFGATGLYDPYFVRVSGPAGNTIMLLPLVIERHYGVSVLGFMDQGQADYIAPILFEPRFEWTEPTVHALWQQVLASLPRVDVVRLGKMPKTVGGVPNPLQFLATSSDDAAAHGNALDVPWPEVEKHLLGPKEVRRKERALARIADARLVIAETLPQRQAFVEELAAQKQRRYVETQVPGFSERPAALAFLKQATEIFSESGNLLLCALEVDGTIAAIQWGLVHEKTFHALVSSHTDGPLSRFSCGRILDNRLVRLLHGRGFSYYDQGYGDEAYKLRNSDTDVPLSRAELALTRRGRVYVRIGQLRARVRASRFGALLRSAKWTLLQRLGLRRIPSV